MKKGFTLIELLVVIAIIGLCSSVVLNSFNGRKIRNLKAIGQQQTSTVNSRFDGIPDTVEDDSVIEPTFEQPCLGIPNPTAKKQCEDWYFKNRKLQECYLMYGQDD